MSLSLKWKVALNMWVLTALCTLAAILLTIWLLLENENKRLDEKLEATATSLLSLKITDYSGLEGFQELENLLRGALNLEKRDEQIIHVYTRRGKMMLQFPPLDDPARPAFIIPLFLDENPTFHELESPDRHYWRLLVTRYQAKNGKDYFLHIAMPNPRFGDIAKSTVQEGILLFIVVSLASFLTAHFLANKMLKPVTAIAGYLKTLDPSATSEWNPLVLEDKSDYLQDIATGINGITRKVKSSLYSLSRTRRYLAHELGNPLTILMGEAQHILSEANATPEDYRLVLKSSLEELDRIQNVVETVLKLARIEKNTYQPVPTDIVKWLTDKVTVWSKMLPNGLEWHPPFQSVIITFDPNLLFRLMDNLIRNIRRHAIGSTETRIDVVIGDKPSIIIEDNGPGMSAELIQFLNEGLTRDARLGIGLVLCMEIAGICHFKLNFENKEKRGLKITIGMMDQF